MPSNPTVKEAYARLGVTLEATSSVPRITPQIRKIGKMLETLNLNLPQDPFYYLAASDHDDARAILAARKSIPRTHARLLPIEAFCVASSVPTSRVPEMIVLAAMRMGVQASSMIAAMAHPSVVKKTVDMALTDGGVEDRQTLHKATGFTPTPKGSHTQINIPIHASASATSSAQSLSIGAPPVESAIKRLSERLNLKRAQSQPALPATPVYELETESEDSRVAVLDVETEPEEEDVDELI